ncbi:MAG: hypothetical protein PHU69_02750 [Fermentimonas sp.]|nr:hypothetical protein [Fermentimonas sp.]
MWQYNNTNELQHFGVMGMKWGVRRYQDRSGNYTPAGKKRYLKEKTAKNQRDIDSFKKFKNGVKDKNGRLLLSKKDVDDSVSALKALKSKKEAKLSRKYDIAKTQQDINRQTSLKDKLVYNNATRKKAAKYVVDKNMSFADATKKAKGDAWRNTAAMLAVYGAVTVYGLKKFNG